MAVIHRIPSRSNIGKFVSVKLVVKFEGERKFVNVQELKIVE